MDVLIVFARAPHLGAAKTRLTPELGVDGAHRLYAAMFADTLALAARRPGARLLSIAGTLGPHEAPGWPIVRQPEGTFGQRLDWTFAQAFAQGGTRCVLIAADAPHMPSARLSEAFAALHSHDVVLGPTHDGGYYLVGLRTPAPWLFEGVGWSTADVFDQTLRLVRSHGQRCLVLHEEFDVDTPDEARRLHELLEREQSRAPRTALALETLFTEARAWARWTGAEPPAYSGRAE
jgi:rSAM/selenodomain-associated transferase 1